MDPMMLTHSQRKDGVREDPGRKRKRLRTLLALRNPVILASGPLGRTATGLIRFGRFAGAVVGKSTTFLPRTGNPHPRLISLGDYGLMNWENLPNLGYERFAEELRLAKEQCSCPVIASLGPSADLDQLKTIATTLEKAGADALELDFKWGFDPQTGNTGNDISSSGVFDQGVISATILGLKDVVSVPIIAKLVAFAGDIVEHAQAAEAAGAGAITAINTIFPAMKIDIHRQTPALSSVFGGLSGKSILPLAVAAVYRIYEAVNIPIIGCGGVTSGEDALELNMAGADGVEMCTTAMVEGPSAFRRVNDEIDNLLQELGFASAEECCGLAHR